jgi:hypothetical protein
MGFLLFSCRTEFRVVVNLARWASGSVVAGTAAIDPRYSLTDPRGALSHIPRGPDPAKGRPEAHLARFQRIGKPSGRTEKAAHLARLRRLGELSGRKTKEHWPLISDIDNRYH